VSTRLRTFWTIWSGQALSLVGSQASQFALVWWLTLETGSPAVLSTATLVALLPSVVLGPAIGALVDRWSRRLTMIVADSAVALGSLVLAGLFLTGRASTTLVLLFLLWRAIGGAFHGAAMLAATSLMVPAEHLSRVQGVNQMLQGGIGIFTAPLGALLLGLLGMTGVMAVDVVTALFAVLPLLLLRIPEPERRAESGGPAPVLRDIRAGLRYLRGLPGHLALIGFAAGINLFMVPAFALLPLLVLQELRGNVGSQAWLTAAFGAGAIGGGLVLGIGGGLRSRVHTALAAIVGLGVATLALGATPAALFPLGVVAMFVVGTCAAVANGSIAAVFQATVAPEYQGRVFTLMASVAAAMTPVGLLLATPIAELAGVRSWYLAGGMACAILGAATFLVRPILEMEGLLTIEEGRGRKIKDDAPRSGRPATPVALGATARRH
jgi:DHA3 family macrolide efflux protein-like MFS transporter